MTSTGLLRHDVSTAALSEWGVGGAARTVYTPANEADLATFLAELRTDEPLLVLGHGAFLVVRDGGYQGVIIQTVRLDAMRSEEAGLYVEAGARCAQVAHHAAAQGTAGFDWMAGVPGSVGGALMTNAGVGTHRLWAQVAAVNLVDRHGHAHRRSRESFGIGPLRAGGNRHPGETIAGVWLHADATATSGARGQVSGARAVAQLFAPEDVGAVMDAGPTLQGPVTLDSASAQLHLDDTADADALEKAIESLCAAAARKAGRAVACRLRFVGESRQGKQGS